MAGEGKRRKCLEQLQMATPAKVSAACRDALATAGQERSADVRFHAPIMPRHVT